mmetsp:Transcript_2702/g.4583  ORF Transcript_2702/g.4583 Transcript_2702/m.4583 type:complete len:200 (-) Transcript_2702:46-645(-)
MHAAVFQPSKHSIASRRDGNVRHRLFHLHFEGRHACLVRLKTGGGGGAAIPRFQRVSPEPSHDPHSKRARVFLHSRPRHWHPHTSTTCGACGIAFQLMLLLCRDGISEVMACNESTGHSGDTRQACARVQLQQARSIAFYGAVPDADASVVGSRHDKQRPRSPARFVHAHRAYLVLVALETLEGGPAFVPVPQQHRFVV